MLINGEFIKLISYGDNINKIQCNILGIEFPVGKNYIEELINKDISRNDANRLMLLKGNIAIKAQEQILKNYDMVLEFNNIKEKKLSNPTPNVNKENKNISIYCDGACSGNPGDAGSGLALYKNGEKPTLYYGNYVAMGTNNIAELNALYKALSLASEANTKEKIIILSDSKYSIDCITTWAYGWKKNGWKKKGGEIKNLELIKNAHNLYEQIKNNIIIKHVKGHSGVEGNELADRMALHAIKAKNSEFEVYEYRSVEEIL
ncbi:MAG: RNase H family protein [Campylobacterota bacterium]|nr:RNase H family protein [Campylobacterota bacterium]